ncbi:MAG: hypothetical protein IT299_02300 [Dehalococcoidia bacterium]|nr:hypothetical protein [Dehalococcoidia bacterium]
MKNPFSTSPARRRWLRVLVPVLGLAMGVATVMLFAEATTSATAASPKRYPSITATPRQTATATKTPTATATKTATATATKTATATATKTATPAPTATATTVPPTATPTASATPAPGAECQQEFRYRDASRPSQVRAVWRTVDCKTGELLAPIP